MCLEAPSCPEQPEPWSAACQFLDHIAAPDAPGIQLLAYSPAAEALGLEVDSRAEELGLEVDSRAEELGLEVDSRAEELGLEVDNRAEALGLEVDSPVAAGRPSCFLFLFLSQSGSAQLFCDQRRTLHSTPRLSKHPQGTCSMMIST